PRDRADYPCCIAEREECTAGLTGFGGSRRHNDVRVLGYTILQPNTDDLLLYSGLHLYEEAVLGFPLPLRERDRVRGKAGATHLLIQTKSAVGWGIWAIADRLGQASSSCGSISDQVTACTSDK